MADDTLNNILNLLQGSSTSNNTNNNNNNNDIQTMLLKFLLSGGLNNIFANKPAAPAPAPEPDPTPPPPRTINLENYQRLD